MIRKKRNAVTNATKIKAVEANVIKGFTVKQVAERFKVSVQTICRWKNLYYDGELGKETKKTKTLTKDIVAKPSAKVHVSSDPDVISRFIYEWINLNNATDAAIKVKLYDDIDELVAKGDRIKISKRINKYIFDNPVLKEKREEYVGLLRMYDTSILDKDSTLKIVSNILQNKETEDAVVVVSDGKAGSHVEKIKKNFSGLTRINAAELLLKATGELQPKLEVNVVPIFIDDMIEKEKEENTIDVMPLDDKTVMDINGIEDDMGDDD